jgi:dienelactone hydrolase
MAILFDRRRLATAPALLARREDLALPLPAVLVYHGLSADKEIQRKEIVTLAEAGLLAVGIDAAGHGERRLPDFEERFADPWGEETESLFFSLVQETLHEVPAVLDALEATGLAAPDRLALFGISMGAYITYGTIPAEPRIRAAVALLGSPEWPHPDSPHHQADRFFPTALLSITGGKDVNVPPESARAFHSTLEPYYRAAPERLRYLEIPGAPHMMSEEDWGIAMREAVGWLLASTRSRRTVDRTL